MGRADAEPALGKLQSQEGIPVCPVTAYMLQLVSQLKGRGEEKVSRPRYRARFN